MIQVSKGAWTCDWLEAFQLGRNFDFDVQFPDPWVQKKGLAVTYKLKTFKNFFIHSLFTVED